MFTLYTAGVSQLVSRHGLSSHLYADDTQIYGSCKPGQSGLLQNQVSKCLDEICLWMSSNRLQLNESKTEVMWVGSTRRKDDLPTSPFRVGSSEIMPVTHVRDLGIHLDSDTSISTHIRITVSTCFGVLRVLRSILHSVPNDMMLTLVSSLVL